MDDESLNANVNNMIKLLKEKNCIQEDEPVTEADFNKLKDMSRAMTAPLFDDLNYHNGYFKPYQISETIRTELLNFYDTLESTNELNRKELENNFLTNIEMIINLRGTIINYESLTKNLNEQLKGYKVVLHRFEEANRNKDRQLSELTKRDTAKIKQWINKNMDSMEKIKLLEKTILQKDADLSTISTSCSELTISNNKLDEKLKKQEKKIREHGTVLSQLRKTHEQEILAKNTLIEELKTKVGTIPQLQTEIKTLREQNSCFTQEKLVLNSQIDKLTRDKNSIKFLHEKVQKDYAKLKTDFDQVNKLNSSYTDKLQNQEELNSRINQLVQELGEFESVKAKITDYQNRITQVENILAETNTKLIASQAQNASSISQINSLIKEIEINKGEFEKQRTQLLNLQAQNIMLSKSVYNGSSPKFTNQVGKQDSRRKNQNLKINTNQLNQTKSYQETQLYSPEQIAQIQNLQQVYSIQQLKAYQNMCLSGQTNLIGTTSPVDSVGSSNVNSPSPTYLLQQAVNQGINQGINQEYNTDLAQQYGPEYAQNFNQQFNQEFVQTEQVFNQQITDAYPNGYITQQVTILYGEDGIPYIVDSAGNFIGYFDPNAQNYAC